jgi:hypothetical protein
MSFRQEKIMNYNSFTQKNKIQTAEFNNQVQENSITLQEFIQSTMVDKVNNTQPRTINLTNNRAWDSDWLLMDSNIYIEIWKSWRVFIGRINQKWINNFQVEIILKNGTTGGGNSSAFEVGFSGQAFNKFIGWDVKDVAGDETSDTKDITLIASIYSNLLNQPVFYAKLLVKYINEAGRD